MKSAASVAVALLLASTQSVGAAPTAPVAAPRSLVPAAAIPDTVPVAITLTIDVKALHPAAASTGVNCYGWVQTMAHAVGDTPGAASKFYSTLQNAGKLNMHSLTSQAYDEFRTRMQQWSGQPTVDEPQYYGSKASVTLPLTGGEYHGTAKVAFQLARAELLDGSTGVTLSKPYVVTLCWLTINGAQAAYGAAQQLPSAGNVNEVDLASTIAHVFTTPIPGMQ